MPEDRSGAGSPEGAADSFCKDHGDAYVDDLDLGSTAQQAAVRCFLKRTMQSTEIPEPWASTRDESSGRMYFINSSTRDTQWEYPLEASLRDLVGPCVKILQMPRVEERTAFIQTLHQEWSTKATKELQAWKAVPQEDGSKYFYHNDTRETRWDDPTKLLYEGYRMKLESLGWLMDPTYVAKLEAEEQSKSTAAVRSAASRADQSQGDATKDKATARAEAFAAQFGLDQQNDRAIIALLLPALCLDPPAPWVVQSKGDSHTFVHPGFEPEVAIADHPLKPLFTKLALRLKKGRQSRDPPKSTQKQLATLLEKWTKEALSDFGVWELTKKSGRTAYIDHKTGRQRTDEPRRSAAAHVEQGFLVMKLTWERVAAADGHSQPFPFSDDEVKIIAAQFAEAVASEPSEPRDAASASQADEGHELSARASSVAGLSEMTAPSVAGGNESTHAEEADIRQAQQEWDKQRVHLEAELHAVRLCQDSEATLAREHEESIQVLRSRLAGMSELEASRSELEASREKLESSFQEAVTDRDSEASLARRYAQEALDTRGNMSEDMEDLRDQLESELRDAQRHEGSEAAIAREHVERTRDLNDRLESTSQLASRLERYETEVRAATLTEVARAAEVQELQGQMKDLTDRLSSARAKQSPDAPGERTARLNESRIQEAQVCERLREDLRSEAEALTGLEQRHLGAEQAQDLQLEATQSEMSELHQELRCFRDELSGYHASSAELSEKLAFAQTCEHELSQAHGPQSEIEELHVELRCFRDELSGYHASSAELSEKLAFAQTCEHELSQAQATEAAREATGAVRSPPDACLGRRLQRPRLSSLRRERACAFYDMARAERSRAARTE